MIPAAMGAVVYEFPSGRVRERPRPTLVPEPEAAFLAADAASRSLIHAAEMAAPVSAPPTGDAA